MGTSPHDSNQNPQDNFEASQPSGDDSGDNNVVAEPPIPSKDVTSGTSTPAAGEPGEPRVDQGRRSQITDEDSDESEDEKNSEDEVSITPPDDQGILESIEDQYAFLG